MAFFLYMRHSRFHLDYWFSLAFMGALCGQCSAKLSCPRRAVWWAVGGALLRALKATCGQYVL